MPRGFFLTFEGLDGSGKTTQARLLSRSLRARGYRVTATRQPGGTEFGDKLRALLLNSQTEPIAPLAEMAVMFADRAQTIRQIIEPALADGSVVICDRFTDSTEAYQGGGRGIATESILALHRALCGDLWPDMTLLLLPDLDASLMRARRRNTRQLAHGVDENRFETEERAFYERVFRQYQQIARRDAARISVLSDDESPESIHDRLLPLVLRRLQCSGITLDAC